MKAIAKLAIGCLFSMAGLYAHAQQEVPVLPVDIFACNYANGSDRADLNRAFGEFNSWADSNGITNLSIYLLTPSYYSDDFEYDFIGLNIWEDGASFGGGSGAMSGDPDSLEPFEGVVDCSSHALYALVGIKPPVEEPVSGGLFEFSNCTMKGNRSNDEGVAAVTAASEFFSQWNLNDAHAALFNIAGLASDTSYQFKWVTYYPSWQTWGSLFDHMVNEGGVQTLGAMLDPVMQCDSSRMYETSVMRMPD